MYYCIYNNAEICGYVGIFDFDCSLYQKQIYCKHILMCMLCVLCRDLYGFYTYVCMYVCCINVSVFAQNYTRFENAIGIRNTPCKTNQEQRNKKAAVTITGMSYYCMVK